MTEQRDDGSSQVLEAKTNGEMPLVYLDPSLSFVLNL